MILLKLLLCQISYLRNWVFSAIRWSQARISQRNEPWQVARWIFATPLSWSRWLVRTEDMLWIFCWACSSFEWMFWQWSTNAQKIRASVGTEASLRLCDRGLTIWTRYIAQWRWVRLISSFWFFFSLLRIWSPLLSVLKINYSSILSWINIWEA